MLRIILTIAGGAIIGLGLGSLQSAAMNSGFEERFAISRGTLAELRGELTREEVIEQSIGTPLLEVFGGVEFEFGTMQHGETMDHEFVFKNVGDGPLNLEMGDSTCKCTVGNLESSVLLPGEETSVKLSWTALSIMRDFSQSATIHTNDPRNSEVRLRVRGQIADSFVIEPGSISLGSISATEGITRIFRVFTYLPGSHDLDGFIWTDEKSRELVRISPRKLEMDPEQYPEHRNALGVHEIKLELLRGLSIGPLSSRIQFTTDLGDKIGTLEVPVTGMVSGELSIVGGSSFDNRRSMLDIGNVQSKAGASVSLWLVVQGPHRDEIVPTIDSVEPAEALQVTIGEPTIRGSRKMFPLKFEVPKGAPEVYYPGNSGKNYGKVVVKTSQGLTQEMPIYVRLMVKE